MKTTDNSLHWERGYRCHALWIGTTRIGTVDLPPRRYGFGMPTVSWSLDIPHYEARSGKCGNVRLGKKLVMQAYTEYTSNHPND
jgi:hypothetical protein